MKTPPRTPSAKRKTLERSAIENAFMLKRLKAVYRIAKRFTYQGTTDADFVITNRGKDIVAFLSAMLDVENTFDDDGRFFSFPKK